MLNMLNTPFYNPLQSYEDNYKFGPYGIFKNKTIYSNPRTPIYNFLGTEVNLPFGIPAGPLINSKYCQTAFAKGFDILVYKTVRSSYYPCHPFPNILSVHIKGDLTLESAKQPLVADKIFQSPISITNSFGVPSKDPAIWQEDVKKSLSYAGNGQVLILSFMGTVREKQTAAEFIQDYILAAKLAFETGVKILEVNLSCPNIGNEGLVCYNLDLTEQICKGIRTVIGNTPLILKVGYYADDHQLKDLVKIAQKYAQAISAINTIQAQIVDVYGKQVLPGEKRLYSGVCGTAIKWAGLDMVKRLNKIRQEIKANFFIIGVGGIMKSDDYFEYQQAGADCMMSATGAMWYPNLAQEIKQKSRSNYE